MFLPRAHHSALLFVLLFIAGFAPPNAHAQFSRREPTPNDALISTEVADDHKVTFRIYAPKADEVSVYGDFGQGGPMAKDDQGVWSIMVGPLTPDFYSYTFVVDGVRTVDPKNPMIKQGITSVESMFLVPGDAADFSATRDVPHGEVRAAWYNSGTLGMPRRMHVYTPPGYEGAHEKYPVLYLLHGGGDDDSGWISIGRAGFILDNLRAAKKAVPMIVVMPNGSLPHPTDLPARPAPGEAPSPEFRAAMEALRNRFTNELLNDIVPVVEKTYRVKAGPENRALGGLSMGGGQALRALTSNPGQFAYVAIWSAGLFGGNAEEWEDANESFLAAADKVNHSVKHLEIVVGDQDFALDGSRALADVLKKRGIKHDLRVTGGAHTWINWRHYLHELAQQLFVTNGSTSGIESVNSLLAAPGRIPEAGPTPFTRDPETVIPRGTPPSFLATAGSGDRIHAIWAIDYFNAMLKAGIPNIELHVYGNGVHAGGLQDRNGIPFSTWQDRYIDWFCDLGFLQEPGKPTKAATDSAAFVERPPRTRTANRPRSTP